jgi:hypothetical protein
VLKYSVFRICNLTKFAYQGGCTAFPFGTRYPLRRSAFPLGTGYPFFPDIWTVSPPLQTADLFLEGKGCSPRTELSGSHGGDVMEKISRIVRGNSRVAAVDMKNAAPVRPGTPSYGRPVGESTTSQSKALSTADRAVALHKEMNDLKMANTHQTIVQNMADRFFMDRMRQPAVEEPAVGLQPGAVESPPVEGEIPGGIVDDGQEAAELGAVEAAPPQKYTPRGSFVDVRA